MTGIDTLLESGKGGLSWFSTFLPRYRAWKNANPLSKDENSLSTDYYQEQGMDVEPLRQFATVLNQEISGRLGMQSGLQQARCTDVPTQWSGSTAANNAEQFVTGLAKQIGTEHDSLTSAATAVSTAADGLETTVRAKADAVRLEFATLTAAGKSGDQVDKVIAYARGQFGTTTDVKDQVALVQAVLPEISSTSTDPAGYCKKWLDTVFVPAVEAKVTRFTGLTDATQTAVSGLWTQLAGALESADATAYTSPNGQPSNTGSPDRSSAPVGPTGAPITLASFVTDGASGPVGPAGLSTDPGSDLSGNPGWVPPGAMGPSGPTAPVVTASKDNPAATPNKTVPGTTTAPAATAPATTAPATTTAPTTTNLPITDPRAWKPDDVLKMVSAVGTTATGILSHLGDPATAMANAYKTVAGDVPKELGEAFKDVVGPSGITGLIHEGVDAAQKIDGMLHEGSSGPSTGHPPGATAPGGTAPGGTAPGGTAPGGTAPGGTAPGGTAPGGTAPGATAPGTTKLTGQDISQPQDQAAPAVLDTPSGPAQPGVTTAGYVPFSVQPYVPTMRPGRAASGPEDIDHRSKIDYPGTGVLALDNDSLGGPA